MQNKTLLLFAMVILCTGIVTAQKKNTLHSAWHADYFATTSQGISREDFILDKKNELLYLITNDRTNLYVHLIINEREDIRSIMDSGITIWVDPAGKNKKRMGARFPVIDKTNQNTEERSRRRPDQRQSGTEPKLPDLSKLLLNIELLNLFDIESLIIPSSEREKIYGTLEFSDTNELYYRLTMPYSALGVDNLVGETVSANIVGEHVNTGRPQNGPGGGGSGGGGDRSGGRGNGPPQGGGQAGGGRAGGGGPPSSSSQSSGDFINLKIKKIYLIDGQ